MIQVILNNSFSRIIGLTPVQQKDLTKVLSYLIGDNFSQFGPRRKSLLSKKCEFPTGLVSRVAKWFRQHKLPYNVVDHRRYIKNANKNKYIGPALREAQEKAADHADASMIGTLSLPTGSGKSLVIAKIIADSGLKTLVVVPNVEIREQLTQVLKSVLTKPDLVTVLNIDSKALLTAKGFECLIIDEAHHVAAKTYQNLNKKAWAGISRRYFLTATPYRNNTEETLLFESIAGTCIYELTYVEAVNAGYIVPVDGYYLMSPPIENDYYTWPEVYSNLVVNNQGRNELIAVTMLKLQKLGPVLCLVKEVKHGKILSEMSGVPFVSGQDQDSRYLIKEFIEGRIKSLIGTYGVLAEGVDTKPAEWVIIAGLGKAKSAFQQQVGRAIRIHDEKDSAKIVLIKDVSHKFCRKHFSLQKKYLLALYGATMQELQIGGSGE